MLALLAGKHAQHRREEDHADHEFDTDCDRLHFQSSLLIVFLSPIMK